MVDPDVPADGQSPTMLLMPAWDTRYAGVKIVAVFPTNRDAGLETIHGSYFLMSGETGVPLAVLDGGELTGRRTAAASVLAASLLARPDSRRLVVVGSGRLAGNLVRAYDAVFDLEEITVWNRSGAGAERLVAELANEGVRATATDDLRSACESADIITCATLASDPVVAGAWLSPGAHLDLVGGFTPQMRETDDEAILRAEVYVDTFDGALREAGDIVQPIDNGTLRRDAIRGDLFSLCSRSRPADPEQPNDHLRDPEDITLFKSVGHALEDLAAASLVYTRLTR